MRLRPPMRADAASIAAISIEVWIGTYLKRGVNGFFADYALSEFTVPRTEALIADPGQFMLVSENDDGIDGFIRLSSDKAAPSGPPSDTEIATLYVQPRHQGKGIGKHLLGATLAHARDTGASAVWLATNSENAPAIAFYLAQGFAHVGETRFRVGDQAYPNAVFSYRFD